MVVLRYGISKVRYYQKRSHIDQVKVHKIIDNEVHNPETWSRNDVVLKLEAKYSFITILETSTGWDAGEDVHVIHVNGRKYIRTDRNNKESDNLKDLPEF
ncbi:MAG: DUF3892 domain-containing protein [Methanobacteriales archaeon HGW-Methanobacteriales-1]|jgi:hypothetical protein|nr:MAG: DUF3892 domain-containing protein [Methanobacteriales archaeon HGW-Methanobacteriales-1]